MKEKVFVGYFRSTDLGSVSLNELIERAKRSPADEVAMAEVVRRFDGLAHTIARSMTRCSATQDDLVAVAREALVDAVRRHDTARPGFARYASRYMWGAARRWHQRWQGRGVRMDFAFEDVAVEIDVAGGDWGDGRVSDAIDQLPPRQQDLLRQRYVDDETLAVIAERSGTSESAVSQRLRTAHDAVRVLLVA